MAAILPTRHKPLFNQSIDQSEFQCYNNSPSLKFADIRTKGCKLKRDEIIHIYSIRNKWHQKVVVIISV